MKIIRSFEPGDRYRYDFNVCSCARGWAQVDTAQDNLVLFLKFDVQIVDIQHDFLGYQTGCKSARM